MHSRMPLALNAPKVKPAAKLAFAERILSNPRHLDSEGIIEHSIGFATDWRSDWKCYFTAVFSGQLADTLSEHEGSAISYVSINYLYIVLVKK